METHGSLFCHLIGVCCRFVVQLPFHSLPFHYQVLGTKYLVLITIISPFLISPFDRVQTTLFEGLNFPRHRIAEKNRSHAEISFRICWWVSWVLVTSEVTRHLNDDSGHLGIPRTFTG